MLSNSEIIDGAIRELAAKPAVFSAADVSVYTDMEGAEGIIETALRTHCKRQLLLPLGEQENRTSSHGRYLGIRPVEKWWYSNTLRWTKLGINCLTKSQLARTMALAFDTEKWSVVPISLLTVGRKWGMVAEGYSPGTVVFPWVVVLRTNPECKNAFNSIFSVKAPPSNSDISSLDNTLDEVLSKLPGREIEVIRGRFGLDTGHLATLDEIGKRYDVTRERIRQIQYKALRRLKYPSCQQPLWRAFANDFLKSGGSLLIHEASLTPSRKLALNLIDLRTVSISELKLQIISPVANIIDYRNFLRDDHNLFDSAGEYDGSLRIKALRFLSKTDGNLLLNAEREHLVKRERKNATRSTMLYKAMRSLGRAAHYTEIASECNRLFPEKAKSTHNWHAALSYCAKHEIEEHGIVWTGRNGMYGLKEHGYSRPEKGLFESIAHIVEKKFSETQQPVSSNVVIAELSKYRRELNHNSVLLALALNNKLEGVGNGKYVPKTNVSKTSDNPHHTQYDISAAFAAFSGITSDE